MKRTPLLGLLALTCAPLVLWSQTPASAPAVAAEEPAGPTIVPAEFFSLPDDLEVTIWARTPQLRNPTNMDIDAAGRIWVTEGANYRRSNRDPKGDRIMVLEDTNGDGVADSSSVFVQEPTLVAPLGIAVIDNRIIVSNAPDLIVYTDVDRDRKFDPAIDTREVLLTGFNGRNHDHALHSVTFGPDGRYYLNQGNAGAMFTDRSGRTFRVGSIYDPVSSGGAVPVYGWKPADFSGKPSDDGHVYVGGFSMRMNPDGTQAEIIGFNYRNSYEQTVTSFGDVFYNDNDDPPACRTAFLLEYANYGFTSRDGLRSWSADRRPGQTVPVAQWRQDDPGIAPAGDVYGGGSPTGIVFYEGDALGEKWRGVLLSCEAARNVVFGYFPQADGAGYALDRFDFFTSNTTGQFEGVDFKGGARSITGELRTQFRPSDIAVGPDGAIYVSDWFDPRVGGHQDLDKSASGAIYRIAPKGFKSVVPRFDLATTEGQITALRSPAVNVRALGYMKLREQGERAVPAVAALLTDSNPYVRGRAIHLLAELGTTGLARVEAQLRSDEPLMRIAAYRTLRKSGRNLLTHARALAKDPSAAVRREVALSLRDVPFAQSGDILLTLAEGYDGKDRTYLEAWGLGTTGKEAAVFAALKPSGDPTRWSAATAGLVWRLTPPEAAGAFAARAQHADLTGAERLAAVTALGFTPTREAAIALLDLAQQGDAAVKETALWWILNYKESRWAGHGLNDELKRRGLYDPAAVTLVSSEVAVPPTPLALPGVNAVLALKGDAARGATMAQACLLCHRLGDSGVEYGPTLDGWAGRQTTEVAIRSILEPSADIAHGYGGTEILTSTGETIHGMILANTDPVIIRSTGGLTQLIPGDRIKSRKNLGRSLMLSAEQLGLSAQDVADVVAYLQTK